MNSGFSGSVMSKMSTSGELGVVDDHRERLRAVLPDEDRVGAVRDRGRILRGRGLGLVRRVVGRLVAEALHQDLRVRRVADVVEVEAADAFVAARLVVDRQHVALEVGRVERDRVRALAVVGARQRRDEGELLRVLGSVTSTEKKPPRLQEGSAHRSQVGRVLVDRDVRDLAGDDVGLGRIGRAGVRVELVRVRRLELQLGEQLDVLARCRQVIEARAVLLGGERAAPGRQAE